jgi:hypothetical protein
MPARLPHITQPMAATQIARPFHHAGWVYEEKVDGWRQGRRGGAPGEPAGAGSHAPVPRACRRSSGARGAEPAPGGRDRGVRSPAPLALRVASRPTEEATPPTLIAFDCLYARGKDLRKRPLRVRRNVLEELIDEQRLVLPARRLAADGFEAWAQMLEPGTKAWSARTKPHPIPKAGRWPGSRSRCRTTAKANAGGSPRGNRSSHARGENSRTVADPLDRLSS